MTPSKLHVTTHKNPQNKIKNKKTQKKQKIFKFFCVRGVCEKN